MSCLPHILKSSNLGKQLGLTKDTAFNTIAEIRELIDSKNLQKQNKPIIYYKELGEPSHATALDYLINAKYDAEPKALEESLKENTQEGIKEEDTVEIIPNKVENKPNKQTKFGGAKKATIKKDVSGSFIPIIQNNNWIENKNLPFLSIANPIYQKEIFDYITSNVFDILRNNKNVNFIYDLLNNKFDNYYLFDELHKKLISRYENLSEEQEAEIALLNYLFQSSIDDNGEFNIKNKESYHKIYNVWVSTFNNLIEEISLTNDDEIIENDIQKTSDDNTDIIATKGEEFEAKSNKKYDDKQQVDPYTDTNPFVKKLLSFIRYKNELTIFNNTKLSNSKHLYGLILNKLGNISTYAEFYNQIEYLAGEEQIQNINVNQYYYFRDLFELLKDFETELDKNNPEDLKKLLIIQTSIEKSFLNRTRKGSELLIVTNTIDENTKKSSTDYKFINEADTSKSNIENKINESILKNFNKVKSIYKYLKDFDKSKNKTEDTSKQLLLSIINRDERYELNDTIKYIQTKLLSDLGLNTYDNNFDNLTIIQKEQLIDTAYFYLKYIDSITSIDQISDILKNFIDRNENEYKASAKKTIDILKKTNTAIADASAFNINGDRIYEYSEKGHIEQQLNEVKNDKDFEKIITLVRNNENINISHKNLLKEEFKRFNPFYNPMIKGSLFIKRNFNDLYYEIISGIKFITDNSTNSFEISKTTDKDWWLYNISSILKNGTVEFMRIESKKIAPVIKNNNPKLLSTSNGQFHRIMVNHFINYVDSLYIYNEGSNEFELSKRLNDDNINKFKKQSTFNFIFDLLTIDGQSIIDFIKNNNKEDVLKTLIENKNIIESVIMDYYNSPNGKMESFKATLVRDSVMDSIISDDFLNNTLVNNLVKDKTEEQKKTIISDLVYTNWVLLNMEYSILFTGNMDYYSNPHKRFGGEGSTGMYLINSNIISSKIKNDYRNSSRANYDSQKERNLIDGENNIDINIIKSSVIKEVEIETSLTKPENELGVFYNNIKYSLEKIYKDVKNININDKIQNVLDKFKSYKSGKIADGQGYVSLDSYKQFLIRTNNWFNLKDNDRERGYNFLVVQERTVKYSENKFDYYKYVSFINPNTTEKELDVLVQEQIEKDVKFVNEERQSLENGEWYFDLPPLKFGARGDIIHINELIPIYDKLSLFPIIYDEWSKDNKISELSDELNANNIGYVKMQSGTKIDAFNFLDIADNYDFNFENKTHDIPSRIVKEQLLTPSKLKLVNTFGSQIRKLINATQFDKGELIFPEIKNDINIFQQSLINIVEDQKNSLFKELGISFNNDDLIIEDPSNFIKELKKDENKFIFEDSEDEVIEINYQNAKDFFIKAFTQNGIPYNLQGILEIENNKFKYNLESTTNKQSIQNLLRGLINRKLINLKINGGQSVLVSSLYTGGKFEENRLKTLELTKEEKNSDELKQLYKKLSEFGVEGLSFYRILNGKTIAAECKKTFTPHYKNLLNLYITPEESMLFLNNGYNVEHGNIKNVKNLNNLLSIFKQMRIDNQYDNPLYKWYENNLQKAVTVTSYRIPTQHYNSMEVMEIVEFLPSYYGDIIIPPLEIVIKSGSDYDIDKLSTILPNISKNGRVYSSNEITNSLENYNKEDIDDFKKMVNDIPNLKNNKKATLTTLIDLKNELYFLEKGRFEYKNKIKVDELLSDYYTVTIKKGKISLDELQNSKILDENKISDKIIELKELVNEYENQLEKDIEFLNEYRTIKNIINDYYDKKSINKKQSYENDILFSMSNILLNPVNYITLLTPNGTDTVKPSFEKVILAKKGEKYYSKIKPLIGMIALLPGSQQLKKKTMTGNKDLLGVFASTNSMLPIIQQVNLGFTKSFIIDFKNEIGIDYINHLIDDNYFNTILNGNEIKLSSKYNEDGIEIQNIISDKVSITVDTGSDDIYGYGNITMKNIGVLNLLTMMGLSESMNNHFIHQPIINKYEADWVDLIKILKVEQVEQNKKNEFERRNTELIGFGRLYTTLIDKYFTNEFSYLKSSLSKKPKEEREKSGFLFAENGELVKNKNNYFNMINFYNNYYKKNFKELVKNTNYSNINNFRELIENYGNYEKTRSTKINNLILMQYIMNKYAAKQFRNFQTENQPDTAGFASVNAAQKIANYESTGFILDNYYKKIRKNTNISPFFKEGVFLNLHKLFFNVSFNKNLVNTKDVILNNLKEDFNKEKVSNLIDNEFLTYLIQNIKTNNNKIGEIGLATLKDKTFLNLLKNQLSEYNEFNKLETVDIIINALKHYNLTDIYQYKDFYNINLRLDKDNIDLKSQIIETFKEIYLNSDNDELKENIKKLAYLSVYQSGLGKNVISFSDFLPIEILLDDIQLALDKFILFDNSLQNNLLLDFKNKFINNNSSFFNDRFQKENFRGKNYISNENFDNNFVIDKIMRNFEFNLETFNLEKC